MQVVWCQHQQEVANRDFSGVLLGMQDLLLLKTGLSNRNLNKKSLKIESFLQKKQKFFAFFLLDPHPKSQILPPHPSPSPLLKIFY